MSTGDGGTGGTSFQEWLLANDPTGYWHAIKEKLDADEAAGITWGVYDLLDGGRLVETHTSQFAATCARDDTADALDRDVETYDVRPV